MYNDFYLTLFHESERDHFLSATLQLLKFVHTLFSF